MTISAEQYFAQRKADRKKEPRYLNVINKDSCTSCQACATVCPVDCIYEVVGDSPSESYHQIDTARCIGCQLCYRVPQESSDHYTLEVCPWNAIDMVHNPNVKPDEESILMPYYLGSAGDELPWPKLEEYGYQLLLDGTVYLPAAAEELHAVLGHFQSAQWWCGDEERYPIVSPPEEGEGYLRYNTTPEGDAILEAAFDDYPRLFMD